MKNIFSSAQFLKSLFFLSLFVILFIASITYKNIIALNKSSAMVIHSYEVGLELELLFSFIKDAETGNRGFLLSNDSIYLKPFESARDNTNNSFFKLKHLTIENERQQENLKRIYKLVSKRFYYLNKTSEYIEDSKKLNIYLSQGKYTMDSIRHEVNNMNQIEKNLLAYRQKSYENNTKYAPVIIFSIFLFTLLILFLAYFNISESIKKLKKINSKLKISEESSNLAEIVGKYGTWQLNLENKKYWFSENKFRLLGCEPNSFDPTIENYIKFVHPDDLNYVIENVDRMIKNENLPAFTYRIIRKDGEIRYLRRLGKLVVDSSGNKIIIGTSNDITEEYLNIKTIEERNNELVKYNLELKIYDESSRQAEILGNYGSWILNIETGRFTYSDNKFRLLGCEPQSFEPSIEKLLEFVHPDDRKIVIDGNKNIINKEILPTINYRIIKKNGKIRNFRTTAKIFVDSLGHKNMIGTTQDITEDVKSAAAIEDKNRALVQSNIELTEFNYVASHDLQEPLRKIQTFISRLNDNEKDNLSESGKDYMQRINRASSRMRVLIDDLLQYSRASKSENAYTLIDLNEIVDNSITELSQIIDEKNAVVNFENLPSIKAIPFQIQQLFTNIISNSLKYSKIDVPPVVNIKSEIINTDTVDFLNKNVSTKYYKISFEDNGMGFEQQFSEKIFVLFNRLHNKFDYPGTGVGLAICKKIIENHKGAIFAIGKPNEGATFTIYLPFL